jgi:pyruvate dehydrogenase E2 component (dihydrolipoamide acetyltransferase)
MTMLFGWKKNVDLNPALKLSAFRKVAIGTWQSAGDPSVYSVITLDIRQILKFIEKIQLKTEHKITITHFIGKAIAHILNQHPELNCILRWGNLYPRKDVDIFFQVASDSKGNDLSGFTLRNADKKSIIDIAVELGGGAKRIRTQGDPDYKKMKSSLKLLPGWLSWWVIQFTAFIQYSLNLWHPLIGTPQDAFGSIMITNIGSLGLDFALAPLVPYSRTPCVLTLGAIRNAPVIVNNAIEVGQVIDLGVTFDHRLIDGMHASKMAKLLKEIFANPENFFQV